MGTTLASDTARVSSSRPRRRSPSMVSWSPSSIRAATVSGCADWRPPKAPALVQGRTMLLHIDPFVGARFLERGELPRAPCPCDMCARSPGCKGGRASEALARGQNRSMAWPYSPASSRMSPRLRTLDARAGSGEPRSSSDLARTICSTSSRVRGSAPRPFRSETYFNKYNPATAPGRQIGQLFTLRRGKRRRAAASASVYLPASSKSRTLSARPADT